MEASQVINEGDRLFHPDEVTDPSELAIGKRIRCHYAAESGLVGVFSGLGEQTSDLIPPESAAAPSPDGDFYYICVDKDRLGGLKLIADRNVQTGISWDTLNNVGIASGSGLPFKFEQIVDIASNEASNYSFSGSHVDDRVIENLFDQDDETRFGILNSSLSGYPAWVKVDLGRETEIASVELKAGGDISRYGLKDFEIKVATEDSGDFSTYSTVLKEKNPDDSVKRKYVINSNRRVRYVVLYILSTYRNVVHYGANVILHTFNIYENKYIGHQFTTRLLTGGVSEDDKDNEWDQYITNGDLGGLITPGDEGVWNLNNNDTLTSTTNTYDSHVRTARGGNLSFVSSYFTGMTSSFRPVLLIDKILYGKWLIDDGGVIKTINQSSWDTVGEAPPTVEMFNLHGMSDLSVINEEFVNQLSSDQPTLLAYAEESSLGIELSVTPKADVIKSSTDIDLTYVESLNNINVSFSKEEGSIIKVLTSVDSGESWLAYNTTLRNWVGVDIENLSEIKEQGTDVETFNNLTDAEWSVLIEGKDQIRFAYYIEHDSPSDVTVEGVEAEFNMLGVWKTAVHGTDYDYEYPRNDKLRVILYKNGDFKINY
ncbi:discoidin domain-containing protein [Cytobacillus sp. Hm23]